MTLILTMLCDRYIVQCSDRRVTYSDGQVSEVMNKGVVIGYEGCAAYTGPAFLDGRHPTEITLMESIADSFKARTNTLERLAHGAERAVRMNKGLPLNPLQRRHIARTSFVLGAFVKVSPEEPDAPGLPHSM